jgi:hypothetical protein
MLLVVFAAEQGSLFAPSSSDYRRYNSLYLTQYGVVTDLGRWTADNTSAGTIAVPELTVYRRYLPERNLVSYEDFLSRMESLKSGGPLYVIVDNIHFRAEAIQAGLNGAMSLSRPDGSIVELRARTLKEFKNPLPGDTWNFAALLEVTDISVVPNKAT